MQVPLKRYIDLLGKYMVPQLWLVAALGVGLFANIGLQLVNPQILRYFIDTAVDTSVNAPPLSAITYAALAFLGVAILIQLVSVATSYLGSVVSWNSTNALREDLASHCLHLDMSFHKSKTPGELIQRVDGDVGILGSFFSTFLITIGSNLVLLVGTLIVLFFENVMVGAVLTASTIVLLTIVISMRGLAVKQNEEWFEAMSKLYGFLEERLTGKEDIRALGAIDYILRRFYELVRNLYRKALTAGYRGNVIGWSMMFSFSLNHAVAIALGAYLFLSGEITLGTVFMIVQYINVLQGPLSSITWQIQQLQQFRASVERVEELLQTENKLIDGEGATLPPGALGVEFKDVDFSYDDENLVLKNIVGIAARKGAGCPW